MSYILSSSTTLVCICFKNDNSKLYRSIIVRKFQLKKNWRKTTHLRDSSYYCVEFPFKFFDKIVTKNAFWKLLTCTMSIRPERFHALKVFIYEGKATKWVYSHQYVCMKSNLSYSTVCNHYLRWMIQTFEFLCWFKTMSANRK